MNRKKPNIVNYVIRNKLRNSRNVLCINAENVSLHKDKVPEQWTTYIQ